MLCLHQNFSTLICNHVEMILVDSAEDPKAEPDPAVPKDAVISVRADICWPWQASGWWDSSFRHRWHGEVRPLTLQLYSENEKHFFLSLSVLSKRLKDVQTLEELGDVYNHFLLYYGRDIPKMQNAAKSTKKRLKKIREVTEDGKTMSSHYNN